jgi:hypothetical protein
MGPEKITYRPMRPPAPRPWVLDPCVIEGTGDPSCPETLGSELEDALEDPLLLGLRDHIVPIEAVTERRLAGDPLALTLELGQGAPGSLCGLLAFHLSEQAEDSDHKPPVTRAGVQVLVDAVQLPAVPVGPLDQTENVRRGPA